MKNTFKKKAIVVLTAFVLILSTLNLSVFASISSTTTGSITVEKLESGVTAYLYRLTTVNVNDTASQPQDPTYYWVDAVQDWIESNYPEFINTDGSVPTGFNNEDYEDDSSNVTTFYSKLIAAIKGGEISLSYIKSQNTSGTATYPVTEDVCTQSVTFSSLSMGTYLVIIENGYRVYTPVVANLTPEYDEDAEEWNLEDVTAECKSTTPTITKTVTDTSTTKDNYSTVDTITYTIVTDIPTYEEDSLSTTYQISDTLDAGLTLNTSSITVKGVLGTSQTTLTAGVDYSVETSSSTFTLDFTYSKISSYDQIMVTYTATLNQDSTLVTGSEGNGHTATLTYSNNPYSSSSSKVQTASEVNVYTYGIEITKVDSEDEETTLEGAEFSLSDANGSILKFVQASDGVYYLSESSSASSVLTTNTSGVITIKGLDEGTYTITETKAPGSYSLNPTSGEVTIEDSDLDGMLDYDENDDNGIYEVTFSDVAGFTLPTTGGFGTVIFVIVGIVLVGLGIWLILISKKRKKNEA